MSPCFVFPMARTTHGFSLPGFRPWVQDKTTGPIVFYTKPRLYIAESAIFLFQISIPLQLKSSHSMAPSAAMLFLSYHQWKPKPSPQPLPSAPPPAAADTSFLVKFSRSPVSRPSSLPAEPAAQAEAKASDASTKRHPTTEDKFQEALELGCWSL